MIKSKIIGFIIVILFAKMISNDIGNIGFNVNNGWSIFILGAVITSALLIIGYAGEFIIFASDSPKLVIAAIDPKAGVPGDQGFAIFLLLGNVVNSFMEEGLFRGTMIPMLNRKYFVKMSIFLQGYYLEYGIFLGRLNGI